MINRNWVCFDCRRVVRQPDDRDEVPCPECGRECVHFGRTRHVPPRSKVAEWEALREQLQSERISAAERAQKKALRGRRKLERQLADLEALPSDPTRRYLVARLRKELNG